MSPWLIVDRYFSNLIDPQAQSGAAAAEALLMKELQEPFYSSIGEQLFQLAAIGVPSRTVEG
jgi:hypothetical protein